MATNPYRRGTPQWMRWEDSIKDLELSNPYKKFKGSDQYNRWMDKEMSRRGLSWGEDVNQSSQTNNAAFNPGPVAQNVMTGQPAAVIPASNGYLDLFKGQSYYDDPTFQSIVRSFEDRAKQFNANNAQPTFDQVSGYAENFRQQFKNYVGRDPNAEEFSVFFKDLQTAGPWMQEGGAFAGRQGERTKGLLKDYFTGTAQSEAEAKARTQAEAAVAPSSAFDTWQQAYRQNVSDTEKSLQDYQARLFEKLRPQLLTSLHSQGLLNTGALNEAFSGAAKDLATEGSNFIAGARSAAEADIANRKYAIQSAPTDYALQNTFNTVPNLMDAGKTALGNTFNAYLQDQAFQNQMRLLERQQSERPSLLSQYGGMMLGGIAGGYAQGLGMRAGRGGL